MGFVRRAGIVATALCLGGAADARADALHCGDVVTHDVVLENDLVDCPGAGLVAAGPDVTIDLNRHRIDGREAGAGIRVLGSDVTVRNGRISDFDSGVMVGADGLTDARLAYLDIS